MKQNVDKISKEEVENIIPRLYLNDGYFKKFVDENFRNTIIEKGIINWGNKNIERIKKEELFADGKEKNNAQYSKD